MTKCNLTKSLVLVSAVVVMTALSARIGADTGMCGGASFTLPFTDVASSNVFFCAIAEAYFSGLTNGTTASTYSPSSNVPREQMAAFVTRTMDQTLRRGSERAALRQFWTPQTASNIALTTVGTAPQRVKSDGTDVWVANHFTASVSRVRASDGKLVDSWTGAMSAYSVLVAIGRVFVASDTNPGSLYQIDPSQTGNGAPVTVLGVALGATPASIAFDGLHLWTANNGGSVTQVSLNPLSSSTITTGFSQPAGILFDGSNIWITDKGDNTLKKLNPSGGILLSVPVGSLPQHPVFDGTNIWVPNRNADSVTVIRAETGAVLATLTGNGLNLPFETAFDGERILVTNTNADSVSLFMASDLTPLGTFSTGTGTHPYAVCSDGLNFWITLNGAGKLARF